MAKLKIRFLGAMFCAAFTSAMAAGEGAKKALGGEPCRQGRAQYASGDVLKAIKTLEKCLEREPANRESWVAMADAALEAGRFQQSAEAFAKAEALKSGDAAFLSRYLSALEGAGDTAGRIRVLRALAAKPSRDREEARRLLAAVESAGKERFPEEYLFALESISETPSAERYMVEKLAAAYLAGGRMPKAEAEYRGLLVRNPESAENWAGLGASLADRDPKAAAECYRKAALYSDQAGQRKAYQSEFQRLGKPIPLAKGKAGGEDALASQSSVKTERSGPQTKPDPIVSSKPAPEAKAPKPFDQKAFQDSVYKAELEKRLAAAGISSRPAESSGVAAAPSASVPVIPASKSSDEKASRDAEAAKAKEADKKAKEEKARQDALAKEAERKAKEEKEKQEIAAKEAEKKAKEEKARQDALAKEAERKAKEEKEKQEIAAKEAEKKAKEEKARQDALAKEEDRKVKEEKRKQELAAKEADKKAKEAERKAKEEKEKLEIAAKEAEKKAKEERVKQELAAKEAEKKAEAERIRMAKEEERARKEREAAAGLELAREKREMAAAERVARQKRAIELFNGGSLDSAASHFKAVLADSPGTEAFYYAGRLSLARGEFAKALEYLGKAPAEKPDLDGLKGRALMALGKNQEAAKALETQYVKTSDDSLLEPLVGLKRKLGDDPGAMGYLEKLADKRPEVVKYQIDLAEYFRRQGDKDKAAERYGKALAIEPSHGEANYFLGMRAAGKGDHGNAVPRLERAVSAFPGRPDAWKALAKGNAALGRKPAAWESYLKAAALAPGDLELARGKLALAREQGQGNDFEKALGDVLRIAPDDGEAAMSLAGIRYKAGDFAAAEGLFRIGIKESKDSGDWTRFGRSLLELKKTDEAAAALQKAVDLGEKDPSLRMDLARIRIDKGDLDGAEAMLKESAKSAPADPEPHYLQGQVALKRQQVAVAEEFFRKSHQLNPVEGRFAEALAGLLRDKDEFKQAISVLAPAEDKLSRDGKLLYGDCLAATGEFAKAEGIYAGLYVKQASAQLLSRRMDLLVRAGKAEEAVNLPGQAAFAKSPEVGFSLAKAQLALIDAHVLQGDADNAVELMKSVVKSDSHRPEYHFHLGRAYLAQNRHKKALGAFTDALTYRVDYPDALYRKGLCLLKLEEPEEADHAFRELAQHAVPAWKARGLYGLSLVFEAKRKPEAVRHHLEKSLAVAPLAEAMAFMSRISLQESKPEEAQEWARKALAADPANESATVALAEALAASKRQAEALELARQGLKARPLSCGLLVQSAKLNFNAGKLESTLALSNDAIKACPQEPMAYYYAGIATQGTNRPEESKKYFKSFRKLGGDKNLVPEK